MHVLNGAIRTHVRTFVYLSSIAVYGNRGTANSEAVAPNPRDPFGERASLGSGRAPARAA